MASHVEANYNKFAGGSGRNGTLVGNWHEERQARDLQGVGR